MFMNFSSPMSAPKPACSNIVPHCTGQVVERRVFMNHYNVRELFKTDVSTEASLQHKWAQQRGHNQPRASNLSLAEHAVRELLQTNVSAKASLQ
jgi:hypothetical protein